MYLFLYHVLCICVTFLVHAGAGVASRGCVSFFVCIPIYFVSCMVYSCIFFLVHAGAGAASRGCVSGNESETVRKLRCLRIWGRCAPAKHCAASYIELH